MCDPVTLESVRQAMSELAGCFDAELVDGPSALAVVEQAACIEKLAAVVKVLAAKRVADTGVWRGQSDRSAAHYLARVSGSGVGAARDGLEMAGRLRKVAKVEAAVRGGRLSTQQAAVISEAAVADPRAEQRLLEQVEELSLQEIKTECNRVKMAALPDPDARRKEIHDNRFAVKVDRGDGSGEIRYRSTIDEIAQVWSVIQGFANEEFKQARKQGRREPSGAYAADGLLAMALAAGSGDTKGP